MFDVTANETIELAQASCLTHVLAFDNQDGLLGHPGVSWTRLAFRKLKHS